MKHEISKRRQPFVRTAVYSFMTLSVVVIVALLTLVVMGYSFDNKAGRLEQGGLLQFASIPQGATVTLDENRLGPRTNTKSTVLAGSHSVSFDRSGYRSWKKTISIAPAQIGWLSYARLIPQNIKVESLRTFQGLAGAIASPSRNYMLLHEVADRPVFVLANIQGDTVRYDDIELPSSAYTSPSPGKTQQFSIDRWSPDEQTILVRHFYDDNKDEWLLLNRSSPEKSINISTQFSVEPQKVVFAGKGNRTLFIQVADTIRRINLDDKTPSRPLASRIERFGVYDEKTIYFTTQPDDKGQRSVGYVTTDLPEPYVLATYPNDGQSLFVSIGEFFGRYYVSVLRGQQLSVTVGASLPSPSNTTSLKAFIKQDVPVGAMQLMTTPNGRFVVLQLPDGYAIYDLELKKYDKTLWSTASTVQRDITWLDDYMIWSDNGGKLRFYEFDGANQQNIMDVVAGYTASLSANDKYIYAIGKTETKFEFKRGLLIVP